MPGLFEILAPVGADVTNLVSNPSAEPGITGYTGSSCTVAQDATNQKRGIYSVKMTPTANSCFARYDSAVLVLVNGTTYYFSVDVLGPAGDTLQIRWSDTSDVTLGTPFSFTATGFWQRVVVAWTENVGATRRLAIAQQGNANRSPIWWDGLMVQTKDPNMSYIDGDQPSCYWNGVAHASTSVAKANTRDNGIWTNLDTFETAAQGWAGLGMPPVKVVTVPYGLADGSNYQRTKAVQRAFTLNTVTGGSGGAWATPITTPLLMHKYRRQLIDAFKPDAALQPAPFWMRYGQDPSYGFQRPVKLQAIYDHGDEMSYTATTDTAPGFVTQDSLSFLAPDPYLYEDGNAGAVFSAPSAATASMSALAVAAPGAAWSAALTVVGGT